MLKIAICDPNTDYRRATADIWSRSLFDAEETSFTFYKNGEQLLEVIRNQTFQADILIIDPLLPDISGLKLIQYIREHFEELTLILQTEADELAKFGYRFHVFDFITKHTSIREIERVINRYISEVLTNTDAYIRVSIHGNIRRIRLASILFFESDARKVRAVLADETIEFYQRLDVLESELKDSGFLRCHQSYLANRTKIKAFMQSGLLMEGEKILPVSRRYLSSVRKAIESSVSL